MRSRLGLTLSIAALATLAVAAASGAGESAAGSASAKTIVVDSTLDKPDLKPADGICRAKTKSKAGCTLRAAIQTANAKRGTYTIVLPSGKLLLTVAGKDEDKGVKGDLDVTTANLTLVGKGPAATTIDGGGLDRVLDIAGFTHVSVQDLRIAGGAAPKGAGIRVQGALTAERVFLESNTASSSGGRGGGIYVEYGAGVAMKQVTLSHNVAKDGGAIAVAGNSSMINVTITGNNSFQNGGGIFLEDNAKVTLLHVTIYGNTAAAGSGSAITGNGSLSIRNSIVAGGCAGAITKPTFPGGNVLTEKLCGSDKVVADPGLQLLATAANGVPVHRLSASSPAINAARSNECAKVDARGISRPQGGGCDSGAVERKSSDP